jgi:diguanylate cyclase (GGDEF)-like protein
MVDERQAAQSDGRVLIVDDEEAFRGILVRRSKKMGLAVHEAPDGEKALERLRGDRYDVLVTDLYMPGPSGLEVLQQAREMDPDLQAIVMTGGATIETAIEALRAGAYDYLLKPLSSLSEFDLSLRRALQHRQLIRENARLFAENKRLAETDQLTGLYNRHKLSDALESEIERTLRYDRPLSMIMLDMDNLKAINDTHGHLAGDEVLKAVADSIRRYIRGSDTAGRFGGDEFVIILPEIDLSNAVQVAERICEHIQSLGYKQKRVSISAGVVQWDDRYESQDQFHAAADMALYEAKRAGGGCIRVREKNA